MKEVRITVERNAGSPAFSPLVVYNLQLDEFYNLTAMVLDLNASDPQMVSSNSIFMVIAVYSSSCGINPVLHR